MAKLEPLGVWLDDVLIATFTAKKPWDLRCVYTEEALGRWPGLSPVLSCSLPLQTARLDASVFSNGLLPEGQHRHVLAQSLGVAANDLYSLLARFGRDVAGALVIGVEEPASRTPAVIEYTPGTLEEEVLGLQDRPLAIHDDSELSIAGLQDKLLLVAMRDGGWGRPAHGYPSTHILKADDPLRPGLVQAESECLLLASKVGLTTVDARVETIGDRLCLIVSRFDRELLEDGGVRRVHQEDLCQALARDPAGGMGRGKYERAGGPSLREAAGLLDRYAASPAEQLDRLLAAATFTVLIGNADAHGKNLALLHPTGEHVELAPLYDTVPTVLWPELRGEGAMTVNGTRELAAVTAKDLVAEAMSWPHEESRARRVVVGTVDAVRAATDALDGESPVAVQVRGRSEQMLAAHLT